MKTIEEIHFNNVVLIEKYHNNTLSEEELKAFLKKLAEDTDLQEDYELLKDYFLESKSATSGHPINPYRRIDAQKPYSLDSVGRFERKLVTGKSLIRNSFFILLAVVLMALTCAFMLLLVS